MGDPFPIYKETLSPMKVIIYTAKLTFASSSISEISKFACAVVRSLGIVAEGISATGVFSCRTLVEILICMSLIKVVDSIKFNLKATY